MLRNIVLLAHTGRLKGYSLRNKESAVCLSVCGYRKRGGGLVPNEPLGTALPLYRTSISLLPRERFLYI